MSVHLLHEHWYAALPSARLGRSPVKARVLELDLVLFRDGEGRPGALLDRCPHRGAPLSLGRRKDGALACRYHGWRFDREGRCVEVPSLVSGARAPGACAHARPAAEQDGYIWVWTGEGQPGPAPRLAGFERLYWRQGRLDMEVAALKGLENHFDICHAFYTHDWSHPHFVLKRLVGLSDDTDELRITEDGMLITNPPLPSLEHPVPEPPRGQIRFFLPNRIQVWFKRPGWERMMWLQFVPTGPESCRMEWLWTRKLPLGRRVRQIRTEPLLFKQDRVIMEAAQPLYEGRDSAPWEHSVEADTTTLTLRRVVKLAAEGRWEAERRSLKPRVLVSARK